MKLLPILCSIFVFTVMTIQSQESPDLPDLPETQTTPSMPDTITPESANRDLPDTNQINPRMPRVTQEQIDKANKDKNWLTEGLKEKEMQAEALREEEARTQKTIIDEILERNQQQMSTLNTQNSGDLRQAGDNGKMKAALSTSAWEPLEPMQSSSYAAAMGEETASTKQSQDYKKYDEKTGITNVFFNPATGSFENQPVDFNSNVPNQPQLQQPWMQQPQNNQVVGTAEKQQVEAFEARMLQQARAQNKLPQNYQNQNLDLNGSSSPLLASSTTPGSPNVVNSNLGNNPFSPEANAGADSGYAASAAKLRMMEEERQRKLKEQNRPSTIDIHSSNQGRKIDINPRF